MQDGALAHYSHIVNYLNITYGNQWVGRNKPVEYPPRSNTGNYFCMTQGEFYSLFYIY